MDRRKNLGMGTTEAFLKGRYTTSQRGLSLNESKMQPLKTPYVSAYLVQNTKSNEDESSSLYLNDLERSHCFMNDELGDDDVNCQIKHFDQHYDQCEKISMPSQAHFFHEYLSLSKPVIITGAIDKWVAFKKWTKSFLKEKYGKTKVHIKATPNGEYEGVQDKSLWESNRYFHIPKQVEEQLPYPDLVVERPASLDMLFSEFLDLIENVSRGNTVNMSAYLEYSSIADYFPELKSDITDLEFINMLELASLNIWLSDGNTLGKLHFDPFDNLLCQISGEKHVTLFEPHNNERLYESHIQESQFTFNKSTGLFHRRRLLDSTSMVMSPVDLKRPDLKRFPLFADTRPMKCSIKEGEVLFMPAFWWHEVQSRPNMSQHRNLAVNFWYKPFLTREFPCPECKLDINPKCAESWVWNGLGSNTETNPWDGGHTGVQSLGFGMALVRILKLIHGMVATQVCRVLGLGCPWFEY
ncbi:hypothetical protein RRG08_051549 [Elysia crispata]|uniref:JmjC domain-containing protein n=1 Tax=Elysia crispata TaxID=231223 RepID=A0AAE0Y107_9GAST|nr:hypothetical protein RRG08_051549 [Elysia crispata]